jgi:DNA-binding transcriptional MerR regulator
MSENKADAPKRLQVGEFAKVIGKSVRALHLYEELGLLRPSARSKGGFRLYDTRSIERARWIIKLQGIGFTLAQIQGFVAAFESAASGRDAAFRARETFESKLGEVREQIESLRASERDLVDALAYLEACGNCSPSVPPAECQDCTQNGHQPDEVPHLVAGLNESGASSRSSQGGGHSEGFDVEVQALRRPRQGAEEDSEQGVDHGIS